MVILGLHWANTLSLKFPIMFRWLYLFISLVAATNLFATRYDGNI